MTPFLEVLLGSVIAVYLVIRLADALSWPFGEIFNWALKKLDIPRNVKTGKEGMIGQIAMVMNPFVMGDDTSSFRGKVRIMGEIWDAKMDVADRRDAETIRRVRIERVENLTLWVIPVADDE